MLNNYEKQLGHHRNSRVWRKLVLLLVLVPILMLIVYWSSHQLICTNLSLDGWRCLNDSERDIIEIIDGLVFFFSPCMLLLYATWMVPNRKIVAAILALVSGFVIPGFFYFLTTIGNMS